MTQQQLAERAGVHRVTIASIEAGDDAQLSTVRKLAEALSVTPEELQWAEDPRVVRANVSLGPEAATVLKWLINIYSGYSGAATGQRMSRDEYRQTWARIFLNREATVLDALIRGGFVVESDDGHSLTPAV